MAKTGFFGVLIIVKSQIMSFPSASLPVPLLLVTSAAGGGLLLRSQVRTAHRRYAATRATVREIDLTVPGVGGH